MTDDTQVYMLLCTCTTTQYVPIIDIPLTAALELLIVPIAMKQSSDPIWARGGTDTITVSDTLVLFSACDFMFNEEQFQLINPYTILHTLKLFT